MANGIVIAISISVVGILVGISSARRTSDEKRSSSFICVLRSWSVYTQARNIAVPVRDTAHIYKRIALDDRANCDRSVSLFGPTEAVIFLVPAYTEARNVITLLRRPPLYGST